MHHPRTCKAARPAGPPAALRCVLPVRLPRSAVVHTGRRQAPTRRPGKWRWQLAETRHGPDAVAADGRRRVWATGHPRFVRPRRCTGLLQVRARRWRRPYNWGAEGAERPACLSGTPALFARPPCPPWFLCFWGSSPRLSLSSFVSVVWPPLPASFPSGTRGGRRLQRVPDRAVTGGSQYFLRG